MTQDPFDEPVNDPDDGHTLDSRPYVHDKCGQVTVISGFQFGRITNPFDVVPQTYCAGCQTFVSLKAVAWVDTGEPISVFRRRMWHASPLALKLLSWYIGPLACAGIGIGIGLLLPPQKVPAPIGAGVFGLLLGIFLFPVVLSWAWKIDYRSVK